MALACLLALALLTGCGSAVAERGGAEPVPTARATAAAAIAQARAQELGDRQLLGQRLVYSFEGTTPPPALLRRVERGWAAGVILFTRNISSREQARETVRQLQAAADRAPLAVRVPLLVMVDQEGGAVRRLAGAPRQSAARIGAGSTASARAAGRAAGRNLSGVGINVNLAPVLDVARPGGTIAKYERGFGDDPGVVGRIGSAFVTGLHDAGVAATAKHFPGFGAAIVNTDDAPVTLDLSLDTLRGVDEAPYPAAIGAGVELVMLSSAIYPALDARQPAAFSRRVVQGELRDRLGFEGVTITDALGVPGVTRYGTPAQVAVRTAGAGNDLLLYSEGYAEGVRGDAALRAALRSGRLERSSLRAAAARVLALRAAQQDASR